jgi:hypothetical protein
MYVSWHIGWARPRFPARRRWTHTAAILGRPFVSNFQHITIFDSGRLLAEADVHADGDLISAQLRVEAGHLPPGTRTQLVDAVLESSNALPGTPVEMTVPAGDAEMLQRVRERCSSVNARATGATCRLDATLADRP